MLICLNTANNAMLQGPDLINYLLGILLRFRRESVAIIDYSSRYTTDKKDQQLQVSWSFMKW